ncbi:beta-galactosidase trimerization domain-containing protein [Streptomyces sp. NPDC002526]
MAGSVREPAPVGILYDWESWWAAEQDSHPSSLLDYRQEALDWYTALLDAGIRADLITTRADLHRHRMLIAPVLHLVPADLGKALTHYAEQGGHLVTTYFSGIVDENDHVWLGGYPGPLRDLLGIRIEEFGPLLPGGTAELDDGTTGTLWTDRITVTAPETEVLAAYRSGAHTGRPAVTRRATGKGSAAYVSTRLGADGLAKLLPRLLDAAGVDAELPPSVRGLVETTVRRGPDATFRFLVNRTDRPVTVPGLPGEVLLGDHDAAGALTLEPRGVAVMRRTGG